ncbi:MAG: glycosyltransferase family 4 protein [Candidatus Woesearchaeota archaeon]
MKVLMLGWEFPPFNTGGLGTACYGLTKALINEGIEITFVIPKVPQQLKTHVRLIGAEDLAKVVFVKLPLLLIPYSTESNYEMILSKTNADKQIYGRNLFEEVFRYKALVKKLLLQGSLGDFDIIHAHDWMTFPAAVELKKLSKKPLVVHVHATEFDRNGGNFGNPIVHEIENFGVENADIVIAVSNFTKNIILKNYNANPENVFVVHNAVDFTDYDVQEDFYIKKEDRIVLFLGRITLQKGPDYFVEAAKLVSERIPNVKFVVVGSGDMQGQMIKRVIELGLINKFLFSGFLRGKDVDRAYKMADVYVMPSVSEPFGITPLEAMRNSTPVIISKQSGVSEVVKHCLKVDFWDVNELANKIIAVLKYRALHNELKTHGALEVKKFSWNEPASKCIKIYKSLLGERNG